MQTEFAAVKKTVAANYERLDKRLLIVERDMDTRIAAHDDLQANLKETDLQLHTEQVLLTKSVHTSAQRLATFKTEHSKHLCKLEGINKHLGDLVEELRQVNSAVTGLVGNQTGARKAMTFARRADEHVTEQGKKFQASDNKLKAQAHLLEELQMKIIYSHQEVRTDIDAQCQKTTGACEELAIASREHKATNENQIGELKNRVDQTFTKEKEKRQIGKSQNAE
jgi:hypothetical protein